MKAHTIPANGGQSVPIPKTNMRSVLEKHKPIGGPDWEGYGNTAQGNDNSGKNICQNVKKTK